MNADKNLTSPDDLPEGFELHLDFLASEVADSLFDELVQTAAWEQPDVLNPWTHKWAPQRRLSAYYGDPGEPYSYTGVTHDPRPWIPALTFLRELVEGAVGLSFTRVLLFYYRDGGDKVAYHTDHFDGDPERHVLAIVTLGSPRHLQLRRRGSAVTEHTVLLEPRSLFVMRGVAASDWQHQVPEEAGAAPRIAASFRTACY